jgi:hypothetical protein
MICSARYKRETQKIKEYKIYQNPTTTDVNSFVILHIAFPQYSLKRRLLVAETRSS